MSLLTISRCAYNHRPSIPPYVAAIQALSPFAYYRLNDTSTLAIDYSGNGYDGTYSGTYSQNQTSLLPSGNGGSWYKNTNAQVARNYFVGTKVQTITAWVNADGYPNPANVIYSGGNACIQLSVNGGNLTAGVTGVINLPAASGSLSTMTNYFVAFTWDVATGAYVYYINGVAAGSGTDTTFRNDEGGAILGAYFSGGIFYWTGFLQEIATFPSVLSPTDIANLYAAGSL